MNRQYLFLSIWIQILCSANIWAVSPRAVLPKKHLSVFHKYCFDCHDSQTKDGGVDLEAMSFEMNTVESAEKWEKVLAVLNSGEMPPKDQTQLSFDEKTTLLDDLSAQIVVARGILSDAGGVITMRRLNRREYENTVFDLLGVRIDAADLPDDTSSHGFDTTGASLFFSSDQLEQYLTLAREALDSAFVFGKQPKRVSIRRESEQSVNKRFKKIAAQLKKDFEQCQLWRASDGEKSPKDFGFLDENDVRFHERLHRQQYSTYQQYLDRPESRTGLLLCKLFNGAVVDRVVIPGHWPEGAYRIRVQIAAMEGAKSNERFLEHGLLGGGARAGELSVLGCTQVTGTMEDPQVLEIPITVGEQREFGLRQRQPNSRSAARSAFLRSQTKTGFGPAPSLWVDWVEVAGPIVDQWPPRAVSEVFFKGSPENQPDQDEYARLIIQRFATRAFRINPPSADFLAKLYGLYLTSRTNGDSFRDSVSETLAVIMASPGFLYQIEPGSGPQSAGKGRQLNDLELAVRLAYFLWSSPPDAELYKAARRGELGQGANLEWHANRMLDDRKSDEFIASFTHQWLGMERLDFFQFDANRFPEFDESVKAAARLEVYETIRLILSQNLPLDDLLSFDQVVVNDLMADYYGIKGVVGDEFRKVAVPEGSPRGGLLAMAAVLAMGSDGTRSSPVERGAWVMRKLLDDPPPPAPANVPQLSRLDGKLLAPRELQEAHMEQPQCSQCHRKIDPIGFGLQNFDAAGKWRKSLQLQQVVKKKVRRKKEVPINASGQLPNGVSFDNFYELRERIANQGDAFSRGFTEALIEYGLGRPYGFSDETLRDQIIGRADGKGGQMRQYILGLIQSEQFRTKK